MLCICLQSLRPASARLATVSHRIIATFVLCAAAIRRARLAHKKGQLSDADYEKEVNEYMTYAIKEQERIGVDVLVHGEPERSDM